MFELRAEKHPCLLSSALLYTKNSRSEHPAVFESGAPADPRSGAALRAFRRILLSEDPAQDSLEVYPQLIERRVVGDRSTEISSC